MFSEFEIFNFLMKLIRSQSRTELLMSKYMEGDDKSVFKLLKREGRKDKALCVQVLQYFGRLCTDEKMINNKKIDDNEVDEDSDRGSDGDDMASEEEKYVI